MLRRFCVFFFIFSSVNLSFTCVHVCCRRQRALQRELDWMEHVEGQERMKHVMDEQSRSRSQAQRNFEQQRTAQEFALLQQSREAKKKISEEIRTRVEDNQAREKEMEEQRVAARVAARERREAIVAQKQREIEETAARRQVRDL